MPGSCWSGGRNRIGTDVMREAVRSRRLACVALLVVLMAASSKGVLDRVIETPTGRAYREWGLFGLGDDEIAAMIENIRRRGLTREEELQLFDSTFGPDEYAG